MVYLIQVLYTNVFKHCPATGMQNGDEALPSISLAGIGQLVKILISFKQHGIFDLRYFGWSSSFSENAHNS